MTPERWRQIRDVLEEVLSLAPEQRLAFLDQACSSDATLRQEVDTLLASTNHVRSSFLQSPPLPKSLTPGTKLGEYEIVALVGSGGMGEVYRARDERLRRDVAIKVLPVFLSADSDRLRRFEQEAQAAAALNHPNILAVFQMGTHEGAPYLVSELLEGEPLRPQLKRGRLAVRKVIDYGVQIAHGLAAAHEKGIAHRDLKPENLFITKSGRVKILDFGLAKLTQPQASSDAGAPTVGTEAGVVMGTVGYMAPEQVRAESTDHRSDIFAFGAILYEMLTGTRAFQKPTSLETMTAILNEDPPGISHVTTNIPPALQRVVHRCLEKNPEQRFQSASDLAFALDALSETSGTGTGTVTTRDGSGRSLLAFIKRHKPGVGAALAVGALLLVAVLYSARSRRLTQVSHAKITHKQFTFSGDAYAPAISPDGLFVAYVLAQPGEQNRLMVQGMDGAELQLARNQNLDRPRWSPDGSEILFFSHDAALYKTDQTAKSWGISVVSRLGGVAHPVVRGAYACWLAPDGSRLVTAGETPPAGGVRLVDKRTGETKDVRLSEYMALFDLDCSTSTGLILAVTQLSAKFQIRIFRPDGSEEHTLVESGDQIYSARWSPSGDSIYYLHGKGSTKELAKISVTRRDAEPEVLASGLQTGRWLTLSADGSRLGYTREDQSSNLWQINLHNTDKGPKPEMSWLTSGTSHYGAPSFSPDGRWIALALGPNRDETNIFKMQAAGGAPVQLTFFEHVTTANAVWSPDGQRLAFISDQNGTPRVWTIGANGGTPQALENTNATDTNNELAWWPSPDIVYQQLGVQNYLLLNDKTHEEKPLIPRDQIRGWVPYRSVPSPDSKKIAVWRNRAGDMGLHLISLQPYSETLMVSGIVYPFGWSPDGEYLYALRGGDRAREIIRVHVANPSEVTSVANLPGVPVDYDGASVSPDGKQIVAAVSEEKSDVWLMENFDPSVR